MKGKLYILGADGEAYDTFFVSDNYNVMRQSRIQLRKLPGHIKPGTSYYVDHTMRGTMIIEELEQPFFDIKTDLEQLVRYRAVLSADTEEDAQTQLVDIVSKIRNPHKLITHIGDVPFKP